MRCCECKLELHSFSSLLQHLAAHAQPGEMKPKLSILENLLSREMDNERKTTDLPKIALERLFSNSNEIEIRLKTSTVPISDDSVTSSSSPTRCGANASLWASKFQEIIESRIRYYCSSEMSEDPCDSSGCKNTAIVECDSTDERRMNQGSIVVYDDAEVEIVKKAAQRFDEISIASLPTDIEFDPLSICAVTMNTDYESDAESIISSDETGCSEENQKVLKSYVCSESGCEAIFSHGFMLARHLRMVHNVPNRRRKEFPCQFCSKVFGWCTDLKRHILTHTGERPFKCKHCNVDYNRKFLLENHLKKKHAAKNNTKRKLPPLIPIRTKPKSPESAASFSCEKCSAKFSFRAQYLCHVISH